MILNQNVILKNRAAKAWAQLKYYDVDHSSEGY
jgi:hypothetical protein